MREQGITRREASRLILLGGCGLAWPHVPPWFAIGSEQQQSGRSAELEKVLERVRRQHQLPGLAAAVVSGTRATVSGVTGVRRWSSDSKLELKDRFHIASCTKSWTA